MTFPRGFDVLLSSVLEAHRDWEALWPPVTPDASLLPSADTWAAPLQELSDRLRENYPHFHPLYAGQMLKPPHPAAVVAYLAAMLVNPNNHALDGGRATAKMEREAVLAIARMFGVAHDRFLGHLTASGTVANLEALWVARELHPDLPICVGTHAHYTHKRMCAVLRAPCVEVPSTPEGVMDVEALAQIASERKIGTVVATLGTTALGALDPLPEILALGAKAGFRVHVDAAYGGYYRLIAGREAALAPLLATGRADSLVIDPHKHGLQPYGCGCVLFNDGAIARLYEHASPYTYFSSPEHHPGETTLECSRAGAAAAALWLTLKGLPLEPDGQMAGVLVKCLAAARALERRLPAAGYAVHVPAVLDIVTYFPRRASTSEISLASDRVFERGEKSDSPLYLAKLVVEADAFCRLHPEVAADSASVTVLRSCLMRPEQEAWCERIAARLADLAQGA